MAANDKIKKVQDMLFGHLSKEQMGQIADILSETSLPKRTLKKTKAAPKVVEKKAKLPEGILDFHSMKLNRARTLAERQDPKWRRSCEYWCKKFQEMKQPLEIHWSVMDDPRATTSFVRDVKAERAEITKIGGGSVDEKTIMYYKMWGMNIPSEYYRKQGKQKMNELWKIPVEDNEEFVEFRASLVDQALAGVAVAEEPELTKEEVGARFERQLEWHFNMEGYHVDLHGRKKKKGDDGVDLILTKNGATSLVQAKAYGKVKKLTPGNVDIIASEMRGFYAKNKDKLDFIGDLNRIILVVANADSLPEDTRAHADKIGLVYKIVPYKTVWPEIKCSITSANRKVYYTPEDSYYVNTQMLSDKKRFWVTSKEEAEALGYKAAKKPVPPKRKSA